MAGMKPLTIEGYARRETPELKSAMAGVKPLTIECYGRHEMLLFP